MSAFPTTEMSANTLFIADKIAISAFFSAPEQSSSRVEFCVLVVFIPGGLERTNDRFPTARWQFFLFFHKEMVSWEKLDTNDIHATQDRFLFWKLMLDLIFIIEQMTNLQNDGSYQCKFFMAPNRSICESFVGRIPRSAAK